MSYLNHTALLGLVFESDIYMKQPKGFNILEAHYFGSQESYSIKSNKSLNELKQFGRMWHNRLSEYLLREGNRNNFICPCIFMKQFDIITVYMDAINIIGTPEQFSKVINCLKKEYDMKDLFIYLLDFLFFNELFLLNF